MEIKLIYKLPEILIKLVVGLSLHVINSKPNSGRSRADPLMIYRNYPVHSPVQH